MRLHARQGMRRRLAHLLLVVLVALTGFALGACPVGRCAAVQGEMAAGPQEVAAATRHGHAGMHHGDAAMPRGHGMHHAAHQQATHCCERDGIASPRCCPESMQLAEQQAAPSSERTSHDFQLVAAQPVAVGLAALATASFDPPRRVPLGAPPGTLIAQHTSLLV